MARACYRLAEVAVFSTATRATDVWEAVDAARKARTAVVFVEGATEGLGGAHLALPVSGSGVSAACAECGA